MTQNHSLDDFVDAEDSSPVSDSDTPNEDLERTTPVLCIGAPDTECHECGDEAVRLWIASEDLSAGSLTGSLVCDTCKNW